MAETFLRMTYAGWHLHSEHCRGRLLPYKYEPGPYVHTVWQYRRND